ncbi:MAG: hypothetical protein ABIQ39_04040 [Ilumatobacteraceae bacterium]
MQRPTVAGLTEQFLVVIAGDQLGELGIDVPHGGSFGCCCWIWFAVAIDAEVGSRLRRAAGLL